MAADIRTTLQPASTGARTRSVALDILRVTAILGVVAIHVFGGIVSNPAVRGSGSWWVATAIDIGNIWVIPVFVMVSGALLLNPRAHADGPRVFYRKRLLRLGPAFVGWQVFYILVVRVWLSHEHLGFGGTLQLIASGTTYTHLFFLWLIAGLYLVAPVLAAFLNGGGQRRAYIFAAVVLAGTLAVYALSSLEAWHHDPQPIVLNALTQWLPYVGYFLAGWALRKLVLPWTWTIVAAVVTAGLLAETIWQYATGRPALLQAASPPSYLSVVVAIAAIGVFIVANSVFASVTARGRPGRMLTELSAASFGVYLVHFFFLVLAQELLPAAARLLATNIFVAVAFWAGIVVVSFAVSIGARRIPVLRRFF